MAGQASSQRTCRPAFLLPIRIRQSSAHIPEAILRSPDRSVRTQFVFGWSSPIGCDRKNPAVTPELSFYAAEHSSGESSWEPVP